MRTAPTFAPLRGVANSPARGPPTGAERQPNSGVCGRLPYASGHSGRSSAVGGRRQEPIAEARYRGDEARLPPVVLESRPQVANLAVHDAALGGVVHAPQRVENLFAGDGGSPPGLDAGSKTSAARSAGCPVARDIWIRCVERCGSPELSSAPGYRDQLAVCLPCRWLPS
jgi:hypothetical protein